MKQLLLISFMLFFVLAAGAQEQPKDRIVVFAQMLEGDTIPVIQLKEVNIYSFRPFKSKRQARRMSRLIKNVKAVYPYARLAGIKLHEYENILSAVEDEKERRQIMKQAEKELEEEFGNDLRQFTFSQGRILIKLVYRETGTSSYELVAELRGKFRAFFWQAFARLFGFNLKNEYDPEGEDADIEFIVKMIEAGQL
ncbi:MAG: DUF4294 domain-containing protein [Bacteroidota bacterium]